MITFNCPHCAQEYTVRPEFAGRNSKCRCCGERVEVPQPPPSEQVEPLAVSEALLPADYGADPLADGKPPAAADEGAEPQDATWEAERQQHNAPAEEDILDVLPAPVDHLEEVPDDDPRSRKKKKDVRVPVLHGIDAVVKIRSPNVVVRYDDDRKPEKIYLTTIVKIDITTSLFGGTGEIRFLIGTRHKGRGRYSHQVLDEIVDQVAVTFPASETRKVMAFKGVVEALRDHLIQDHRLGG